MGWKFLFLLPLLTQAFLPSYLLTGGTPRTQSSFFLLPPHSFTSLHAVADKVGERLLDEECEAAGARLRQFRHIKCAVEVEGFDEQVVVRVAQLPDYPAIAELRLTVSQNCRPELEQGLRERSFSAMQERRREGALCCVAACGDSILGSLELSTQEFPGTDLEGLYVTEVAVREGYRRRGLGKHLFKLVDMVASGLQANQVYLHVDELNFSALHLYRAGGYKELEGTPAHEAFTESLGLGGGFLGKTHLLMGKPISESSYLHQ
ncbi:unnamed protein product [Chrysoparadoxa australica]